MSRTIFCPSWKLLFNTLHIKNSSRFSPVRLWSLKPKCCSYNQSLCPKVLFPYKSYPPILPSTNREFFQHTLLELERPPPFPIKYIPTLSSMVMGVAQHIYYKNKLFWCEFDDRMREFCCWYTLLWGTEVCLELLF